MSEAYKTDLKNQVFNLSIYYSVVCLSALSLMSLICSFLICGSKEAYTQINKSDVREYRIVRDEKGIVENVIIINDKVYFIFEKDKAKELLIKVENYDKLSEQVQNLSSLNSERKAIIEQKNIQLKMLELSNSQNFNLATKCSSQDVPFYKSSEFMFMSGFVLSTTGYYLYQQGEK